VMAICVCAVVSSCSSWFVCLRVRRGEGEFGWGDQCTVCVLCCKAACGGCSTWPNRC
jgi:hypothetical protein